MFSGNGTDTPELQDIYKEHVLNPYSQYYFRAKTVGPWGAFEVFNKMHDHNYMQSKVYSNITLDWVEERYNAIVNC